VSGGRESQGRLVELLERFQLTRTMGQSAPAVVALAVGKAQRWAAIAGAGLHSGSQVEIS